jgi:hypothetical protein
MGRRADNSEERRAARRFEVAWDIAVQGVDTRGRQFNDAGALRNLSSSGALFLLPRRLKRGAMLEIEIRVPMKEKSWMKYAAKVVRVKKEDVHYGVAVNFATVRPTFTER